MAKLLMNLRGVPEDEADAVRALLDEHAVAYYETPPNRWGLSMGAIWIRDGDQYAQARQLLDDYQQERVHQARVEQQRRQQEGTQETLATLFRRAPGRNLAYLGIIAAILYFSIQPFFSLIGD